MMRSPIIAALSELSFFVFQVSTTMTRDRLVERIRMKSKCNPQTKSFGCGFAKIDKPISGRVPMRGRLVVQEHIAEEAGPHWDVRIVMQKRAVSFVLGSSKAKIKAGEPFSVGRGRVMKLIKQPDHTSRYADFEGEIKEGYGKGMVRKIFDNEILIIKAQEDELQFTLNDQKITIFKMEKDWGMNTSGASTGRLKPMPKGNFTSPSHERIARIVSSGEYVAEEKIDGSNFTLRVDSKGKHLVSWRQSVSGKPIDRTLRMFDRKFHKIDLPSGTVIQGEVWHKRGPYMTAGLLNSHPFVSFMKQRQVGPLHFTAWDISMYDGKDLTKLSYESRRKILEDVCRHHHVSVSKVYDCDTLRCLKSALRDSLSRHGEGLVLKHKSMTYGGEGDPMIKFKPVMLTNAKVVSVNPGTGKFIHTMGSLTCQAEDGREVFVGTGFSDALRDWIWSNREGILDQVIEVGYFHETEGSFRGPRFHRISPTQSTLLPPEDLVMKQTS